MLSFMCIKLECYEILEMNINRAVCMGQMFLLSSIVFRTPRMLYKKMRGNLCFMAIVSVNRLLTLIYTL